MAARSSAVKPDDALPVVVPRSAALCVVFVLMVLSCSIPNGPAAVRGRSDVMADGFTSYVDSQLPDVTDRTAQSSIG
jgi:hypothetical protein